MPDATPSTRVHFPVASDRGPDDAAPMIPVAAAVLAACIGTAAGTGTPLVGPGFSPAFVVADATGDSLAFEADSLVATSSLLMSLHGGYHTYTPPTRSILFRIRTTGRLAVLVDPAQAPAWTAETARRALLQRHATAPSWPHAIATSLDGFEFPHDWYRRAGLEVANGFDRPIRVTWVAFESPDSRQIARAAALRSVGLHATLGSGAPEPVAERPAPPSPEALGLTVRIVGSVRIDPRSGRVEP